MTNLHTHPRTDDLAVFWVPADVRLPMEIKVVKNHFRELGKLVNGDIEQLPTTHFPELPCGCILTLWGNEQGVIRNLPLNPRLMSVSLVPVRGDVFLVGTGLVSFAGKTRADDVIEPDMFSLPQPFSKWKGPGHPLPTGGQPWEPVRD